MLALLAASGPMAAGADTAGEPTVVTGSNIPMAASAPAVPVTVIDQQGIAQGGVSSSLLEILRKGSPLFSGSGNSGNENAQNSTAATYGGSRAAVHNLATLVLIDGRRVADDPAEAEGGAEFVDLNMIPVAAVERIEVLPDGDSAVYGSGAVGGVVNIILRRDFTGSDIGGRFGFTANAGHYAEREGWIVGGASRGGTSVAASLEYTRQDPVFEGDRDYTDPAYGTNSYPGHIDVFSGTAGFSDQFYQLARGVNAPPGGGGYTIGQLVAMGVYVPITAAQSLQAFNLANGETLSRSLRRASAFASINHAIRGDSLAAFGSVLLSSVRTQSQLNAVPLVPYVSSPYSDLIEAGSTPPPPGTTYVLSSAPTNPFSGAFINGNQDFASGALVLARNRFTDFPRVFRDDDTLLRVVGGLRGRVCDRLNWEAAANFSRYRIAHSNGGLIDTANLVAAMNAGSVNPFAIRQPPGALPGDVIGSAYFNGSSTLEGFDARIFGDLVDLAGGAVGYSLGASWQVETLRAGVDSRSLPDPLTGAAAGWSGAPSLQPFSSRRDVASVCAEVSGPVVGPGQGVPWVREVNLDVAARLDDTPGVGTSLSPKAVLSYEPVGDTFRLRFSAGGAFVAPTLFDRFGPDRIGSTSPITFNDYGGGQTRQVQFNSVAQSSRSLAASTASTWTAGFDWTPGEFRGFSVSADYHQVVQKKIAGGIDPAVIAQGVESDGAGSTYARYVHFGSPGGPGVTGPGQLSTAVDSSVYVDTPLINEAARASTGIDGTIAYAWGTEGAPRFEVASTVSVFSSYGVRALPSGDYLQYAGHASVDNGTLPRYRAYTALSWAYRGAEVAVAHTVIPPVTDIGQGGGDPVPVRGFQQFDISCSFRLGELHLSRRLEGLTVSAGVNNVFNREPPPARGAFPDTNVDVGTYNGPVGREVFASLDYRF